MTHPDPGPGAELLPPGGLEALAPLTARWRREGQRIVIYAAGNHTQMLLRHSDLGRCRLLAIADSRTELHGSRLAGLPVIAPEAVARLRPDAVLVSSFLHQEEIAALLEPVRRLGIQIATLYPAKRFLYLRDHILEAGFRCRILPGREPGQGTVRVERPVLRQPGRLRRGARPGPRRRVKTMLVQGRPWIGPLYRGLLVRRRILLRLVDAERLGEVLVRFSQLFRDYRPPWRAGVQCLDLTGAVTLRVRRSGERWRFPGLPSDLDRVRVALEALAPAAGETVLQAGAYVGVQSLALAQAVGPRGRVWALEPDPRNFQALGRNLRVQGAANVRPVPAGVWSRSGRESFHAGAGPHSRLLAVGAPCTGLVSRPMWTLEALGARLALPRVDALSLSLEGAEAGVLAQAAPWLARVRPRLLVATHLGPDGRPDLDAVLRTLESLGYRVVQCQVPGSPLPLLLARP